MALVREAVRRAAPALLDGIAERGFGVVDAALPAETVLVMRAEADALRRGGSMVPSESTRWDEESGKVQTYQKPNVLSTNLVGGELYFASPRLHEYCVSLVATLPSLVNQRWPSTRLSNQIHTNKLAVCMGDGSHYAKHYDNSGGTDLRKLTVLLYLQNKWDPADGGCFRMFFDECRDDPLTEPPQGAQLHTLATAAPDSDLKFGIARDLEPLVQVAETEGGAEAEGETGTLHTCADIAPVGGRLLAFWSDTMVHGVLPSFASEGADAHRWALTIWLHTDTPEAVRFDSEVEERHFGGLRGEGHRFVAG